MTADDDPIAFDSLPRAVAPPPELADRIQAHLVGAGLLRSRGSRWRAMVAAAAAFALGLAGGRTMTPGFDDSRSDDRPRFLLLLYPGDGSAAEVPEATAVREYSAWAAAERERGRHIDGERLADHGLTVERAGVVTGGGDALQGYFVVTATTADEAVRVASASPHVRHGGRIVVRAVDTPR